MTQARSPEQRKRYTVVLSRPGGDDLAELRKLDRFQALINHNAALKQEIESWLEERGLQDEVSDISEPTAFSMIFLTTVREVAEQLLEVPGVEAVSEEVELEIDLDPAKQATPIENPDTVEDDEQADQRIAPDQGEAQEDWKPNSSQDWPDQDSGQ